MDTSTTTRIQTGVPGLDGILRGGFLPGRAYLVGGGPGTGKTIFGLHFLTSLLPPGKALFVSFTQTEESLRRNAEAVGISTDGISFLDLTADPDIFSEVQSYDIFSPVEVEREPITKAMREKIEDVGPERIFVDGFSELRMISADMFHFVRLVQSFFRFTTIRGSTVLVSATEGIYDTDIALQSATDGVIRLAGSRDSRSLEVIKMRGSGFAAGTHSMRITGGGLEIFPEAA